ncbi:hypothetical protein [Desulfuribacillus alkaliarsenatis]|uniref:Lipoprotein n=1 Tax=Desulfuribacillus alkaliarsenatis TaxID=766136 RepID=A0A1E5FZN9_9FIRM|nr:hypothetical protein [Desulfuribacillus alkaliarsenatis]OEF95706.1 hypothetical protein BHF68_11405 [Desulfuribacillus alkaliarsenatis]
MVRVALLTLVLLLSLAITGCFGGNTGPTNQPQEVEDTTQEAEELAPDNNGAANQQQDNQNNNQPETGNNLQDEQADYNGDEVTMTTVRYELFIGMTEKDVIKVLGNQYKQVIGAMDNSRLWRFDINTVDGYVSPDDELDTGDIDGLLSGALSIQVFIQWDDTGLVNGFSALYLNEADGRVYSYYKFEDGSVIEQAITN